MSAGGKPRRFRLARGTLFLAAVAPIILAAAGELVWTAIVAFSGDAPPSPTETPLAATAPAVTATAPVDYWGCPAGGLFTGKVSEQWEKEGLVVHPDDFRPIPRATVRIPELGLEAVADEQGCYSISGPPIEGPRLLTFEFSAPGFGPLTIKNLLYQGGMSGWSPVLERVTRLWCETSAPGLPRP